MKFLIRDDDICFFTKPEELENSWGWLWQLGQGGVNFAVIPFIGLWEKRLYPVGENKDLVEYLKGKIKEKKAEILLHGYSHLLMGRRFEFESQDEKELSHRVREGREYLERIFQTEVKVFVPPNNALSRAGLKAVSENKMAILSAISLSPLKREPNIKNLSFFLKRKLFSYKYRDILQGKFLYPYLANFSSHRQLDCFSLLPERANLENLIKFSEIVKKYKGILCLATHYWEIDNSLKKVIRALVEHLLKDPEVEFSLASEVFRREE